MTGRRWEREPVCTVVVLFVQELFWDGQLDTKFKKEKKGRRWFGSNENTKQFLN